MLLIALLLMSQYNKGRPHNRQVLTPRDGAMRSKPERLAPLLVPTGSDPEAHHTTRDMQCYLVQEIIAASNHGSGEDATRRLLARCRRSDTPFDFLKRAAENDRLLELVRELKTGDHRRIAKSLDELALSGLDVTTCTSTDLEAIFGISPQMSERFLNWARPGYVREPHAPVEKPPKYRQREPHPRPKAVLEGHTQRAIQWLKANPGAHPQYVIARAVNIPSGSIEKVFSDRRFMRGAKTSGRLNSKKRTSRLMLLSPGVEECAAHGASAEDVRNKIARLMRRTIGPITAAAISKALGLPYALVVLVLDSRAFYYDPPRGYTLALRVNEGE
jgi:hypothetical protein